MKRILLTLFLCLSLLFAFSAATCAAETDVQASEAKIEEQAPEEEGFFLLLYEAIGEHLPQIFSALSLLAACIIGLCYKKGLLPILHDSLSAIGAATKDYGRIAENQAEQTRIICENANNNIHFIKELAEKTEKSLEKIKQRLDLFEEQKKEGESLRLLLEGQVDMLCDIFLSSALPQFEKDRVFGRVEEMKAVLHRSTEVEDNAKK